MKSLPVLAGVVCIAAGTMGAAYDQRVAAPEVPAITAHQVAIPSDRALRFRKSLNVIMGAENRTETSAESAYYDAIRSGLDRERASGEDLHVALSDALREQRDVRLLAADWNREGNYLRDWFSAFHIVYGGAINSQPEHDLQALGRLRRSETAAWSAAIGEVVVATRAALDGKPVVIKHARKEYAAVATLRAQASVESRVVQDDIDRLSDRAQADLTTFKYLANRAGS